MIQDIKEQINRELPAEQSFSVDINAVVTAGRRVKRRRRILTGTALSVVAAVSAGALLVAGLPSGDPTIIADDTPSMAPPTEQPAVALPELEPDAEYVWEPGEASTTTQATEHYSAVMRDTLAAMYPEYEAVPTWGEADPSAEPEFVRIDMILNEITAVWPDDGEEWEALHNQPVYALRLYPEPPGAMFLQFEEDSVPERVTFEVWPKGGFTTDTDGVTDLIECEDYSRVTDFDGESVYEYACSEDLGPSGELVRQSSTEVSHSETGATFWRINTTVVYRLDGTAVVIENQVSKEDDRDYDDALGDLGDRHPGMSLEQQLEFALALPGTVVE